MDTIIQGQLQSPIVKDLNARVEHRMSHLVHDIPDNAPISSFNTITVLPYRGDVTVPNSRIRFKIPRAGMLCRSWLRIAVSGDVLERSSGVMNFGQVVRWARLLCDNQELQILYAPSIFLENSSLIEDDKALVIMHKGREGSVLSAYNTESYKESGTQYNKRQFSVMLPFSLYKYRKDAMDTDFLKEMEVEIELERGSKLQQTNYACSVELVAKYFTLHPTVANNVRNTNYLKGVPETLLTSSWWKAPEPVISSSGSDPPYLNDIATFDITNDFMVSDIGIAFRFREEDDLINERYNKSEHVSVCIEGNGTTLYTWNSWDPHIPTPNADALMAMYRVPTVDHQGGVGDRVVWHMALSMHGTDEFLQGGLNLKHIVNARLVLQMYTEDQNVAFFGVRPGEKSSLPQLYLKYPTLTRLDGETGEVVVIAK